MEDALRELIDGLKSAIDSIEEHNGKDCEGDIDMIISEVQLYRDEAS